jgi:hypothetical protein
VSIEITLLNFFLLVDISEEYTKITTPRQDVLFKKGYLGRKRPTATPTADTTANVNSSSTNPEITAADVANGNFNVNGTYEQDGGRANIVVACRTPKSRCVCQYFTRGLS